MISRHFYPILPNNYEKFNRIFPKSSFLCFVKGFFLPNFHKFAQKQKIFM